MATFGEVEVVPAIFGAAAGLAGLLLVFLGVSIGAFQSFAGDTPAAATAGFRRAGGWILGAFLLGHDLSPGKVELVGDVRDLLELLLLELREKRHPLDQLDLAVFTQSHVATLTAFRGLGYFDEMEVVPAIFGAAAGLAGLLLVFLGVSMSAFQSFAGDTPAAATAGFRRAGGWILGAFLLGLADVAVAFSWLLSPHRALRDLAVVLFAFELAATAWSAVITTRVVLWR